MCRRHQDSLTSGGGDVQSGKTVAISCFVRLHDPLLFFKGALIDSEKPFLPKAKSSKIKTLDSRLCGNNDFFSVSLNCTVWPGFIAPIKHQSNNSIIIETMDASLASPVHLALYCLLRAQPAYTACAHTLAQALGQLFTEKVRTHTRKEWAQVVQNFFGEHVASIFCHKDQMNVHQKSTVSTVPNIVVGYHRPNYTSRHGTSTSLQIRATAQRRTAAQYAPLRGVMSLRV